MFSRSRWMEVALSLSQQMQMMEKYLAKLTLTPTTYTLLEYLLLHIYSSSCLSRKITISITYILEKNALEFYLPILLSKTSEYTMKPCTDSFYFYLIRYLGIILMVIIIK